LRIFFPIRYRFLSLAAFLIILWATVTPYFPRSLANFLASLQAWTSSSTYLAISAPSLGLLKASALNLMPTSVVMRASSQIKNVSFTINDPFKNFRFGAIDPAYNSLALGGLDARHVVRQILADGLGNYPVTGEQLDLHPFGEPFAQDEQWGVRVDTLKLVHIKVDIERHLDPVGCVFLCQNFLVRRHCPSVALLGGFVGLLEETDYFSCFLEHRLEFFGRLAEMDRHDVVLIIVDN
jgi:hypothetical protein